MGNPQGQLRLVGPLYNFVEEEPTTALDAAHGSGLTFVAMDARAWPDFGGQRLTDEWIIARHSRVHLPELEPWPRTGWRFKDRAKADEAFRQMREHVLSNLPGVSSQEDRSPERLLNDPEDALGEAFLVDGEEVLYLSCDRGTEARLLELLTGGLAPFDTHGATPMRYASYNSQTAPHLVATGGDAAGAAEHLVVAFSPGNEQHLISTGLPGSTREDEVEPFTLEVPSGVLVLAWGRIDGGEALAELQGQDPGAALTGLLGDEVAAPLATPFDDAAPGPLAWIVRLRPGTYHCALRFLETPDGISAMALSHTEATPLWSDMTVLTARPQAPVDMAAATRAAQDAQARLAAGDAGDDDPEVFPGQPLARLSDYVRLMKGMQTGDMQGALQRAGLDMMSYAQVAQQWGTRLASDPSLTAKYAAMMAAP